MKRTMFIASFLVVFSNTNVFAGDAENGKIIFNKKCSTCHLVGPDAKNIVGPALNNIIDNPVASVEGYKYGKSLRTLGDNGAVWNIEEVDKWLINQKKYIRSALDNKKAKSKMNLKVKKEDERADLIAYLSTLSE